MVKEVVAGWRRWHSEELRNLYTLPNIIMMIISRRMRWARHVTHMEELRNGYRILVRRPERKRPLKT
jgi:hypothetical protein